MKNVFSWFRIGLFSGTDLREKRLLTPSLSVKLLRVLYQQRLSIPPIFVPIILVFSLLVSPPTVHATDTIQHPELPRFDRYFWTFLPELLEWSRKPRLGAIPPLPDPPPLTLGCPIPGCDLVASGPEELEISLSGSLAEAVTIEVWLEGLHSERQLEVTGPARPLKQQNQFEISKGTSRLRGEALNEVPPPVSSHRLVDALMDPQSSLATPTVNFRLLFNETALEKLQAKAVTLGPPERELATMELIIWAKRKGTAYPKFKAKYTVICCWRAAGEVDQIHLTEPLPGEMGGDQEFGQEAVVLANGLMKSTGWTKSVALKATTLYDMPDNVLFDNETCEDDDPDDINSNYTLKERCRAEISVFAPGKGMKLRTPVGGGSQGWNDDLGDKAPVQLNQSIVKVPVHFYILWEHATGTRPPSCTLELVTECLAESWLSEANLLHKSMNSGIEFEKGTVAKIMTNDRLLLEASCDVEAYDDNGNTILRLLQRHFGVDHYDTSGIRVYFVRSSIWHSPAGNIHASGWTCAIENPVYNDIIISTETAKPTTLAHELGHALSLQDINDVDYDPNNALGRACTSGVCLDRSNLMWSGSNSRTSVTKGQSFRANVNRESAIHRNESVGRVLSGEPRVCTDDLDWHACPRLTLDR